MRLALLVVAGRTEFSFVGYRKQPVEKAYRVQEGQNVFSLCTNRNNFDGHRVTVRMRRKIAEGLKRAPMTPTN